MRTINGIKNNDKYDRFESGIVKHELNYCKHRFFSSYRLQNPIVQITTNTLLREYTLPESLIGSSVLLCCYATYYAADISEIRGLNQIFWNGSVQIDKTGTMLKNLDD